MPKAYIYQYVYSAHETLWLPTHIPEFFDAQNRSTWPPDAFLVPRDGTPAECDAILRAHLTPALYADHCCDRESPESRAFLETDEAEARATSGPPASTEHALQEAASPESKAESDAQQAEERASIQRRERLLDELARARASFDALREKLPEPPLQTPPPPLPPSTPPELPARRALLLERGPDSKSPALVQNEGDGTRSFLVDERFTGFKGDELNFLIWAEKRIPKLDGRRASWLLILTQTDAQNEFRECCGEELARRHGKIVRWLREYYQYQLPRWLGALKASRQRLGETPPQTPGLDLPGTEEDFSTRWEPAGRAAQLLECSEAQLSRICRNVLGQNPRELWDSMRIKFAGVAEMYEYELRALRHKGYGGEEEEPGPDGTRKSIKRARRTTGRTRATVAQRLGFLNNARLDRGFWHAQDRTLSEFEAQVCARLAAEGTYPELLAAHRDLEAQHAAASSLSPVGEEVRTPASYLERMERTACTNLKNLLRLEFTARARVLRFARKKAKLFRIVHPGFEWLDKKRVKLDPETFHKRVLRPKFRLLNESTPAQGNQDSPPQARDGNGDLPPPDPMEEESLRRERRRFYDELSPAHAAWEEFAQELATAVAHHVPLPVYSRGPEPAH